MAHADPFSTSTMLNASHHLRFAPAREPISEGYPAVAPPHPRGFSVKFPPPGFTPSPSPLTNSFFTVLTPQELEMRLQWFFYVMIKSENQDAAPFKEMILKYLDQRELQTMASLLTSDSDYFLMIARNKNGSKRIQKLLGITDDVDTLFAAAILRRFLHIITDKYASYVARRGIAVFNKKKKEAMYERILHYALYIARDKHGCLALNDIITDADDLYYRNKLFDVIAHKAILLSNDAYGNFVIQHVLKLNDLCCKNNIVVSLRGHFVDLSIQRYGSYIVNLLLETEESMVVVVEELLEGDRLMRLTRNTYGNFVVCKALRVTQKEMVRS
ncbi:Pumilio RNA-binding repeat [Arabidopsis thaliana x Arabidopsis arenosa]|uniref:Pumilio RNA-binding repeat n=1 Tax=Arabidopsis thaliana x Arabidopsis arenosa TaxID=1240361 RepID=A0A8T2BYP4_9BRAS|nr:Pumilio RNA-binding repeat [Arabidopsis thaliana x Arabidopsis arenosa]